jgi:hypothetical protein
MLIENVELAGIEAVEGANRRDLLIRLDGRHLGSGHG